MFKPGPELNQLIAVRILKWTRIEHEGETYWKDEAGNVRTEVPNYSVDPIPATDLDTWMRNKAGQVIYERYAGFEPYGPMIFTYTPGDPIKRRDPNPLLIVTAALKAFNIAPLD